MYQRRDRAKTAALALVKTSNPDDEVCILDFNDEPFNGLPQGKDFTSDIGEMQGNSGAVAGQDQEQPSADLLHRVAE
jgi:hypothetical protein